MSLEQKMMLLKSSQYSFRRKNAWQSQRTRVPTFFKSYIENKQILSSKFSHCLSQQLGMGAKGYYSKKAKCFEVWEKGSTEEGLLLSNSLFPASPNPSGEGCRQDGLGLDYRTSSMDGRPVFAPHPTTLYHCLPEELHAREKL